MLVINERFRIELEQLRADLLKLTIDIQEVGVELPNLHGDAGLHVVSELVETMSMCPQVARCNLFATGFLVVMCLLGALERRLCLYGERDGSWCHLGVGYG